MATKTITKHREPNRYFAGKDSSHPFNSTFAGLATLINVYPLTISVKWFPIANRTANQRVLEYSAGTTNGNLLVPLSSLNEERAGVRSPINHSIAQTKFCFGETFDLQPTHQGVTFHMVEKFINELESKIQNAEFSNTAHKNDLLQSLARLKNELAAREKQNLAPLRNSVDELRSSVEGFEQSHPKLVEVVNRISSSLSNLGI